MNDVVKCVLICGGISLGTALIMALLRLILRPGLEEGQKGLLATATGFAAALFAIVLGLTIFHLWNSFNRAEDLVRQETNDLRIIFRLTAAMPGSVPLDRALSEYVASVAADEWPAMARGQRSPRTEAAADRVWREGLALANAPGAKDTFGAALLGRLADFNTTRRERLSLLPSSLHPLLLLTLSVLGLLTLLGFVYLGVNAAGTRFLFDVLVAAAIAFSLCLMLSLDRPFSGKGYCVTNEAFVTLSQRMAVSAAPPPPRPVYTEDELDRMEHAHDAPAQKVR